MKQISNNAQSNVNTGCLNIYIKKSNVISLSRINISSTLIINLFIYQSKQLYVKYSCPFPRKDRGHFQPFYWIVKIFSYLKLLHQLCLFMYRSVKPGNDPHFPLPLHLSLPYPPAGLVDPPLRGSAFSC